MIVGSGIDIVKISRIENLLTEKRNNFLEKIFTEEERKYIEMKNYRAETVSGMFSAKESISKLLGTGLGKINWKDIVILHNEKGKPYVKLYNEAYNISSGLKIDKINLSISHEKEYAITMAIGENTKNTTKSNKLFIPGDMRKSLPKRDPLSHKGSFGRVGVISGSIGMTGATYLSTMSALRTGSGLVYTIVPKSLNSILSIKLIEAIIKPVEDKGKGYFNSDSINGIKELIKDIDVLAIGPGIGQDEETIDFIQKILLSYEKPVVLDADGINCIAIREPEILLNRKARTIITPHLGELSRLLKVSVDEIKKNPVAYSKYTSNKYNVITVLKGKDTIVSNEDGKVYINTTGNPGMATAGSGDLLTGIIASFIGQGIDPYDASKLGVFSHGIAGDLAKEDKGEYGMIGRDILENIPYSIKLLQG